MPSIPADRRPKAPAAARKGATSQGLTAFASPASAVLPSSICAHDVAAPTTRPTATAYILSVVRREAPARTSASALMVGVRGTPETYARTATTTAAAAARLTGRAAASWPPSPRRASATASTDRSAGFVVLVPQTHGHAAYRVRAAVRNSRRCLARPG